MGFADIVDKNGRYVWKVKLNSSTYNEYSNRSRYINASFKTLSPYFPLTAVTPIAPFSINWSPTEYISVRAGNLVGPKQNFQIGMIYYQTNPRVKQPIVAPSPQESWQKQKNLDVQTVAIVTCAVVAAGAGY